MDSLWSSSDLGAWSEALDGYDGVIAGLRSELLTARDPWYCEVLPAQLAARPEPFVTIDELVGIVEWKMARGVWRARNLHLVKGNPAEEVVEQSRRGFREADDPRRALGELCKLGGVGPATASAVLAVRRPDAFPFFDELVAAQIPGLRAGDFSLKAYLAYAEALGERARQLDPSGSWSSHQLGTALWVYGQAKLP